MNGSLILILGLLLVLFINLIAPIFVVQEIGTPNVNAFVNTVDANGNPITLLIETPAPKGYTTFTDIGFIREDPLTVVRIISLIGLGLIVFIDYFAVRWVANRIIQPINQISHVAKRISAQSLNQHLGYQGAQDEIKDLADAFDLMLMRLEANFEQQGQFISNLAHELRTPLTSMRMNVEALRSDPQTTVEDYQQLSATLEKSLSRLERLIQDLLLLAKGDKEIAHHPIILGVLFEELLEELGPFAKYRKVNLRVSGEMDCEIWGDPILIQRALFNLVENGILYNRPDGSVEISCCNKGNQVVIEVRDTGIGISDKDQSHIFQRFYRATEIRENNHNGKGLGLAITEHIIRLHQGYIKIESHQNLGSVFRVFLPQ